MLINMREKLLPIQWNMACLDEAHVIKSAHTEIAKTVLQLKATTRLALTGTPLQNKAIDIWTIFQFLNPGLLGERSSFYSQYASTPQKMEQMRKVLSPFILRRTKKEVLHELPSKTESIIRTEMSSQVLLLSLKAGGVGLNLTEACIVIHLDAWWNPAIENQATDRVYRIGQKQNVLVYHLIARNTVEDTCSRPTRHVEALQQMPMPQVSALLQS